MGWITIIDRNPVVDRRIRRYKLRTQKLVTLITILATGLTAVSLLRAYEPGNSPHETPARVAYISHAPILIIGNDGFLEDNSSTGIGWGSGTMDDPYLIENWDINSSLSDFGIWIQNTDAHFTVRNCYVHEAPTNTYGGISLSNCSNGDLDGNTCWKTWIGIWLYSSNKTTVRNNTCSNCGFGISLSTNCTNNTVFSNTFAHCLDLGAWLIRNSTDNQVWNNVFYYNNGASDYYVPLIFQARDDCAGNWWNSSDGYGNYWSDWTEPDADVNGIVDFPYNLEGSAGAMDYYPLTDVSPIPEFDSNIVLASTLVGMMVVVIGFRRGAFRRKP